MSTSSPVGGPPAVPPAASLPQVVVTTPGGIQVSPAAVGAPFVIAQSGHVDSPELLDPAVIDRDLRDRADYVRDQELVVATREKRDTSDVIDVLLQEIAEEAAHIKYERRQRAKAGKDTLGHTSSRVVALKNLAELLLKRKEASLSERLDLKSPRFQKIFQVWMEFFYDSMEKSGIGQNEINLVFETMKSDMVGWERKMENSE